MHELLIEKHPFERLMPFANVEDAVVLVILMSFVWTPPTNVLVDVFWTMRFLIVVVPPEIGHPNEEVAVVVLVKY